MTRPYRDRPEDAKARVRANSQRYAKSPAGVVRRRARMKALLRLARANRADYLRLYDDAVIEEWDRYEREHGAV